jgi:phage/plasmid-like protein (TIGR03299 family)
MAHMIDSLAWTGAVPWHGLGREIPKHATVDEMIRFGGLDWQVVPRPLFAFGEDGNGTSVDGYKALVRSDRPETVLSVVSEGYGIVQNDEALSLAAAAVGDGVAAAEVCGALDEGRRIFVVLNVEQAGMTIAGERIEPFVVCYTGHDGSTAVGFRFTPVRVVCANTLAAALSGETPHEITVRHTRNAADRVKVAATVIGQARSYFGRFNHAALELVKRRLFLSDAEAMSAKLFPTYTGKDGKVITPINQTKVIELFKRQPQSSDANIAGTRWGYYNAVTALVDHNMRGGKGERRMERALGGSDIKDHAMQMLLAA